MCGNHCQCYYRKAWGKKSYLIDHTAFYCLCVCWGFRICCIVCPGADCNDYDETGWVSIPDDSGIIFIGATCSAMLPYAINITNIMPAQYLGTSMGSAPILGWVAFIVSICIGYFYMVYAARKAAVKEGTAIDESKPVKIVPTRDDLPGFGIALIPLVLSVGLVLALSNLTKMDTNAIVVFSLFIGSLAIVVFC